MTDPGLSVCLIVRDAAATIERALESVRAHVDELCVYDTGSSDGTVALLERLAAAPGAPLVVEKGEWRDDFGWARERSFALSSEPWRMYLDADDVVVGGERLRALVAAAGRDGARGISVAYDHHDAPDGTVSWLWTNRILHRDSGHWEGVVHELWRGLRLEEIALAHPAAVRVQHLLRTERPRHYERLIELAAAAPEHTPRGQMMLGFELLRRDDRRAVVALRRYLDERHDASEGDPNGFHWIVLDQLSHAYARLGDAKGATGAGKERDAYTARLSAAIAAGEIEDVEFWRMLLGRMDELVASESGEVLLPGPAAALHSPNPRDAQTP
jgi:glycosyltransferase involved in cell wall biosynthesis